MKVLINNVLTELTPKLLAEVFWNMDSAEQATFFNELDTVADFHYPFQLQSITENDGLTLKGRRVMQQMGDYSHWGITCKILKDNKL